MEVWLGFAGGMASELLDWFRIRKELHLGVPGWAKSWLYWAITVAMAGVGGTSQVPQTEAGSVN